MKHLEKPIVVVKKRKHKGHSAGHGSWKIAYADFMTAMMAFFLVMWLISIASPAQLAQIADYFRTPLSVAITGGHRLTDSTSPIPGGGNDVTKKEGEEKKQPKTNDDMQKLHKTLQQMEENKRLKRLQGDLNQLIEADPKLRALRPHLRIDLVKQGLRIQIIDSKKRPMFKLGSAEVEPYMRDILRSIAPVLNTIPNKITISGHTDDLPYAKGERSYSNWELSADRANASRRELVIGGLDEGKVLRVVGMAATMNLSDKPDDALNRRISLIVLNKAAEEQIRQENQENENVPLQGIQDQSAVPSAAAPISDTPPAGTPPASDITSPTNSPVATPAATATSTTSSIMKTTPGNNTENAPPAVTENSQPAQNQRAVSVNINASQSSTR